MGRLTTREQGLVIKCVGCIDEKYCYSEIGCDAIYDALEKLKEYEDLEEQGLLLKLPCKLRSELYDITEFVEHYDSPDIYLIDASRIEISKDKEGLIYTIDGADYREKDFGTVLFTSEEEAEKALAEMGE